MRPTNWIHAPGRRPAESELRRRVTLPVLLGALLAFLAIVALLGACTEPYCESNDDCKGGAICNPATNTCTLPDQPDAGDAGVTPDGGDATTPECTGHDQCQSVDEPVCIDEQCAPCDDASQCLAKDDSRPLCDGDGHCVECLDAAQDCADASPICDGGTCRPCGGGTTECETDYPDDPVCVLGACVQCADGATDCENPTPVCDTSNQCAACSGDQDCIDRGQPGAPACDNGSCVGCTDSLTHCTDPDFPICDTASHTCRGCESHADCNIAAGVCDWDTGGCLDATHILHVDGDGACDTNGPGTVATPFCEIYEAIPSVSATRNTILVESTTTPYQPLSVGGSIPVRILTLSGAEIGVSTTSSLVTVNGGNASLILEGFGIRNAIGSGFYGVECSGAATVTLLANDIHANDGGGVSATNCTIDLQHNDIYNNDGGGVSATNCTATLFGNLVDDNDGGGVTAAGSTLTLDSNTVSANGAGGIRIDQCGFSVINNLVYANGVVQQFWGGVYITSPGTPQEFAHNTVAYNFTAGTQTGGVRCGDAVTLVNSIIYGNDADSAATTCTYTSCWLYTDADPELDATTRMLTVNSPCRDGGTAYPAVPYDIEGQTRDATAPDIGADEYYNP